MFKLIKKIIKFCLPYGIYIILHDSNIMTYFRSKKIFNKYYNLYRQEHNQKHYSNTLSPPNKKIIYMADGRTLVGGLTDRFAGMTSLYEIARDFGFEFKINFTNPFMLTDYLVPNKYDWTINKNDIIYNTNQSAIYEFSNNVYYKDARNKIWKLLKNYNQLHVTTNAWYAYLEYADIFDLLFKPSTELKNLIDYNLLQLSNNFISATFRFQSLLGDFNEGEYPTLPEHDRIELLERCLRHLEDIYKENNSKKILVTSDSITFLNEVKKYNFVYIIPGEITHIDYSHGLQKDIYMKSFIDYFILTYSKKLYLVIDGQMYRSGFPYRASLHRNSFTIKRY